MKTSLLPKLVTVLVLACVSSLEATPSFAYDECNDWRLASAKVAALKEEISVREKAQSELLDRMAPSGYTVTLTAMAAVAAAAILYFNYSDMKLMKGIPGADFRQLVDYVRSGRTDMEALNIAGRDLKVVLGTSAFLVADGLGFAIGAKEYAKLDQVLKEQDSVLEQRKAVLSRQEVLVEELAKLHDCR
jgi:hypothetical protein